MRSVVCRVPPDRFAKPVHRRLRVAIEPVGVAGVEEQVGVVTVEAHRIVEKRDSAPAGRRRRPPKLYHTEVIEDRGITPAAVQCAELGKRGLKLAEV